jgi:signal transduction histidine kinase
MSTQLDGAAVGAGVTRARAARWRALAGLTPQLVGLVAVLMLARMLSSMIGDVIVKTNEHEFGAWLLRLLTGFAVLVAQAVPMLLGVVATANLGPQRGLRRVAALAAAVVLSTGVGLLVRLSIASLVGVGDGLDQAPKMLPYLWPRYAVLGGMLTIAAEFYRREVESAKAMQRALIERAALETEMAEARLQVLQAQIEPHFLFNTLANVRRLYDTNCAAGRETLEKLMRYLEVALPRIREGISTLGGDAELVEAFLHVQQVRMGPRLEFHIEIPASLRAHPVPPMMVLTLVENAIKHGLNPSERGGLIRVEAGTEGDQLLVSVADTGVGFPPGAGGGTGLANIRGRLAAQFGDRASLKLDRNELGGVTATLALPLVR